MILFHAVAEASDNGTPSALADIKADIRHHFHVSIEKDTLSHMIDRDPRVRPCPGIPMEAKRVAVTPDQIADLRSVVWVVPSSHKAEHVNFPIPRTGKRITLIACIALDGSFLSPTVDSDLILTGMTPEKVIIKSQRHGFVNTPIFDSWMDETFLPELRRRREAFQYAGLAVLMLDNCSFHMAHRFLEACDHERVLSDYLPPDSSNQLQPLDLSIFGITKRLLARINRLDSVNVQSRHIAQLVSAFMSAATPVSIVEKFRFSGICLICDDDVLRCQVRSNKARCVLVPFGASFPGCGDQGEMSSDEEEIRAFGEDVAELLYDLDDE
jgi:hypothetical protein